MQEFKVNEYITLKLENDETIIYVAGERFRQCKQLILNLPITEIKVLEELESIDEAIEKIGALSEDQNCDIPPETEFWGHSSNLQVWSENNYNTNLIHSNLAFPLLKKLTKIGDLKARKVFKEEISKRFENGIPTTQIFLLENNFLDYLTSEELEGSIENLSIEKCRVLSQKIVNLSSTYEGRNLIYEKISSLDRLFKRLLNLSEGVVLLEYLQYSNYKQLKPLLEDSKSSFLENLLLALKKFEFTLGWNPFYFLENLFLKIARDITGYLKRKIIKILKRKDKEDLLILIKLQWFNSLKEKDLINLLNNPKINLRSQMSKLIKEKTIIIDFDVNCYDLIFILIFLEKIRTICGKYEVVKFVKSSNIDRNNLKKYIDFIKKNLDMFELRDIEEKKVVLNRLFEVLLAQ